MISQKIVASRRAVPLAVAASLAFTVGAACAQSAASPSATATDPQRQSPIVVTGSRSETRSDQSVSEVVVIDRAQIERAAGRTLVELLAREAGLQFATNGGLGGAASVFIRGAEARHTVLIVDGVRYGSATTGTPTWDNWPLAAIERIEVLKGPASALYGCDGAGGVVQIFTRRGKAGLSGSVSATLGSLGFNQLGASLLGGEGGLTYAFGLQRTQNSGESATSPNVPFGSHNPDRDGFSQLAGNGSVSLRLSPDWVVDARLVKSSGKTQFDDGAGPADTRAELGSTVTTVGASGNVLPNWKTRLTASSSADQYNQVASASVYTTVPSTFDTRQNQLTWQNDVQTPWGTAVLGLESLTQRVDSTVRYTVTERRIAGQFVGLNGAAGAHSWQANLRRDNNSQFGSASTGFAGYGFALDAQWRVRAAYGTSFVTPSFNQLYYPGFSNPLLQPERGRNTDLGVTYTQGGLRASLTRFDNKIRGFITSTTKPANIPHARITGWTLGVDAQAGPLAWRASLDELNPRNEVTGRTLPRRSKVQANLGFDYATGPWQLGTSLIKVGDRFDNTANTTVVSGYTTVDVHAKYALAKDLSAQLRLNNLGNSTYETVLGYPQPGRGAFVTVNYQVR